MTLSLTGEKMSTQAKFQAMYRAELAERVVDLRTCGFNVLHYARPSQCLDRWAVEWAEPTRAVLHDYEAARRREDRTLAITDFGDKGLLVRSHAYYQEIEMVEVALLSNDKPLYFKGREYVGRTSLIKGHQPVGEESLTGITQEGLPLNLVVAELFGGVLESLHATIEQQKTHGTVVRSALGEVAISPQPVEY